MRVPLWLLGAMVCSGGCLGGLEDEWGAAGVAPAAAYAIRIDSRITVQHRAPGKPVEAPRTIEATIRGILYTPVMDEFGTVPASFQVCRLELPPVDGRKLVFRDDVWPRIAPAPLVMTRVDPVTWSLSPWAILMGLKNLADPVNERLPTDPNDPRVDRVEDDQPGVRIGIQVTAYGDPQIDASVRVRLPRGTVAQTPEGELVGEVELAHDVWVWYANMPWPISDRDAAAANAFIGSKMAEWPILSQHHALNGVPVDAATDCAHAAIAN